MAVFSRIIAVAAAGVLSGIGVSQGLASEGLGLKGVSQGFAGDKTPSQSRVGKNAGTPFTSDAAEILKRSAEVYANLAQFDVDSVTTAQTTLSGSPATLSIHTHWTALGATKIRLSEDSALGPSQRSSLVIADGENLWAYSTKANEYTKVPIAELPGEVLAYAREGVTAYFQTRVDDSKFLREETIEIDGHKIDCFVVQLLRTLQGGPPATSTRWIDKRRFVVVREDQPAGSDPSIGPTRTEWHLTNLNESIPDEVFRFIPPPGAKLVDKIEQ